jgi:phosphatidylserine decarboxylase
VHPRPTSNGPTARLYSQNSGHRPRFSSRLRDALKNSKVQWYQLPIGVGIGFVGLMQFYKTTSRERERQELEERASADGSRPKRRERIRPDGPWQVQVMSTLPLKAISRICGRFNELTIPYYLRVPGFKLYSWIFGVK